MIHLLYVVAGVSAGVALFGLVYAAGLLALRVLPFPHLREKAEAVDVLLAGFLGLILVVIPTLLAWMVGHALLGGVPR